MAHAPNRAATKETGASVAASDQQRSLDQQPESPHPLARLQFLHGNQAVLRMFGDSHERGSTAPRTGRGEELDPPVRRAMESRIGVDLGDVRVHTGGLADQAARSLSAAALTVGQALYFRSGRFAPHTPAGERLLAHELVHVAQARQRSRSPSLLINRETDSSERQARMLADGLMQDVSGIRNHIEPSAALISLAPETWYRGEAVGVSPSKPGGSLHDLGDGMYLTNDRSVADLYADTRVSEHARRSPDAPPATPRTRSVTIERSSLGKVLDLTKDKRWNDFLSEPIAGHTREKLIRSANENYSRFFKEFVKTHKIDLKQYDAIIGPEFVRGGTQVCVRNPAKIAEIDKLLKPVARVPSTGGRGGGSSGSGGAPEKPKSPPAPPAKPVTPKPPPKAETVTPTVKPAPPPAPSTTTGVGKAGARPTRSLPKITRISYASGIARVGTSVGASVGTGLLLGWMWEAMKKSSRDTPSPKREVKEASSFLKSVQDKDNLKTIDLVSSTIHEYAREGFSTERGELWQEYFKAYFDIDALPDVVDRRAGIAYLQSETLADIKELETMLDNVNEGLKFEKEFNEKIDAANDLHEAVLTSAGVLFYSLGIPVEDISKILDNLKFYAASHRVTLEGLRTLKKDIREAIASDLRLLRMLNAAYERGLLAGPRKRL